MKILQVVARYYPDIGGVEEHVRNISERLARKHEVIVCATDSSGKLAREETIGQVKVKRFESWAPGEAYFFSRQLKKYLDENSSGFDVVHAHGYHSFPPLYAAQSKKENKFFFTPHYHGTGHTFLRRFLHRQDRMRLRV
jgi:glycosyltransferase involved in cell wall biosynthesis